uniref:FtsQ protein, putative n=1 Tax=Chlorobium chlorochromatii (strain CaD3) TaxID=340177 RepID=Q3ANV1_CHLCH
MPDDEYQEYYDPEEGELVEEEVLEEPLPAPTSGGGSFVLIVVALVLLLVAGLASVALQWKQKVVVRNFIVEGESVLKEQEILAPIEFAKGHNLQLLEVGVLKSQLLALPYVHDVVVRKEFNGTIRLRLHEREPVALTVHNGHIMVIDREGFLLPWRNTVAQRYPKLLTVYGTERYAKSERGLQRLHERDVAVILEFIAALAESDYASLLIRELHLDATNTTWSKASQSSSHFIFGNDGRFNEKLKNFEIFWQKVISKKGFTFYNIVDLRFKDRVFTIPSVISPSPQEITPL